ncbi:MAG: 3-deoxy-manno-octulosonate cytidylyltransferase [Bacteroidales bacterium]|nr:MAG: 3-deoxy-manno-octulosonate cytidylyltransferase [Bacteroidales bacterium]
MQTDYLVIIPARYASSRFPGKPLVDIGGKPMIRRVYEQASKSVDNVYVATDDERILQAVNNFRGKAVMTSPDHKSGTDRCAEAVKLIEEKTGKKFKIIINVQGDEPFLQPEQLETIKSCFIKPDTEIATLVKPVTDAEIIFDENKTKVIVNNKKEAVYFSRSPVPFIKNQPQEKWVDSHRFYLHIGLYAYRKETLSSITKLNPSALEIAESLEQLRWIENGYKIKVEFTEHDSLGIDTPEDLANIEKMGLI